MGAQEGCHIGQEISYWTVPVLEEVLPVIYAYLINFSIRFFTWYAGSRCHQLEQISGQLSAIIEKKDELISRLQQPFVGEFLEIDAAHHK